MKTIGIFLAALLLPLVAVAQEQCGEGVTPEVEVQLTWDIPTKRQSGATLSLSEIEGYDLLITDGTLSKTIRIDEPGTVEHEVAVIEAAQNDLSSMQVVDGTTLYFTMSTIDSDGRYGDPGQTVSKVVDFDSLDSSKACAPTVREVIFRLKIQASTG